MAEVCIGVRTGNNSISSSQREAVCHQQWDEGPEDSSEERELVEIGFPGNTVRGNIQFNTKGNQNWLTLSAGQPLLLYTTLTKQY